MRISVFGLGYVGVVTLVCLAEQGHDVWGVDIDNRKLEMLESGRPPVDEPGLSERLNNSSISNHIHLTGQAASAVKKSEIGLICVGTPPTENGGLDTSSVCDVLRSILGTSSYQRDGYTIVVRSTLNPGTVDSELVPLVDEYDEFTGDLIFNPEFLREGSAIDDFYNPPFIVVGSQESACAQKIRSVYRNVSAPLIDMGYKEAEMLKFVCNAFHALKVSFANEIGTLASSVGADPDKIMSAFVRDKKLNISGKYLRPGFAFGGSCLPKDVQSIVDLANKNNLSVSLLESILPSNEEHIKRAARRVLECNAESVAILGLSFKSSTDDLRNSPSIKLAKALIEAEQSAVYICPVGLDIDEIYGQNLSYLERAIPDYEERLIGKRKLSDVELCALPRPMPEVEEYARSVGTSILNLGNI